MGKRRDARVATLVADAVKASLAGTPAAAGSVGAAISSGGTGGLIGMMTPGAPLAAALARDNAAFGGALGPGFPFRPIPLDELGPDGRPLPRKFQYDVADNLNITKRLPQWQILASAAVQVDIMARCISIRQSDVTKMDWSWNVSSDAVNTIMEDNQIGIAEASKIARQTFMPQIVRLSQFWDNPYPQSDRAWEEWVTEFMWQFLVYDGVPVHPAFTLGGKLLGVDIIDASTIKILLDNYGDFPRPPDPAYQQVLWGFPRGEFIATANSDVTNYLGGEYNVSDRDQLSYFVMNRRTNTPYGFSPTEQALPIANIYLEREAWMLAEYKYGTMASVYMRTNSQEIDLNNMSSANRVLTDYLAGSTASRQSTIYLPDGFDPVFAPMNSEKYKADWDEFLKKSIAAYYGVAPSQVGVVARAGLGGGKGMAEGEQDGSETVSAKPQNKYIERCVNALSRRYMGATRDVTFVLKDDEGAEDEVEISKANQTFIMSAQKTPNEVRGELGLPLSTLPEADELMIVTPAGPVYLTGTLEAQLNPPAPPPVHVIAGGTDGSEGPPPQGQEKAPGEGAPQEEPEGQGGKGGGEAPAPDVATDADKVKEKSAYFRWNRQGRPRGSFAFKSLTIAEQAELIGGQAEVPKGSLTKRTSAQMKGHARMTVVARAHSRALHAGLVAGVTGVGAAVSAAMRHYAEIPGDPEQIASFAISQNVTFDSAKASAALGALYRDAAGIGAKSAAQEMGITQIGSRSLDQLLGQRNYTLSGIDQSARARMTTAIRDGLVAGDNHTTIASAVNAVIDDPARSGVISITESNRAYNGAFLDQVAASGQTQWWWVVDGDPCEECLALEAANPQDISNEPPPEHPNCMCTVSSVAP